MARVHFPSLVDDGENPKAQCVAYTPNGTLKDGIGGDGPPWASVPQSMSGNGPVWSASGELMFAAMAPSLQPERMQVGKTRKK